MLILASGSPRRSEILTAAGISFRVLVPGIEEEPLPSEAPQDYVRRLARDKAEAVKLENADAILAADTVVVVNEHILEKPDRSGRCGQNVAAALGSRALRNYGYLPA